MVWRLYKRKSRNRRKHAIRGVQYDGSRWELHKSYETEERAKQALENLSQKDSREHPFTSLDFQYKIVEHKS